MHSTSCDLLLFFTVSEEGKQLKLAARSLGISFDRKTSPIGDYIEMGRVGDFSVIAIETEMGPIGFGGSASRALIWKAATGARAIVHLGMAFGIDDRRQKHGDIVVSTAIIPYDCRTVRTFGDSYTVDYTGAEPCSSSPSMLQLFRREYQRGTLDFDVHIGALLSGGARIYSKAFRDELVANVPAGDDAIVGGEMEAVGLLSAFPSDKPEWIVVKGISDFADEKRDEVIKRTRPLACRNSAFFVLNALINDRWN